jgi:DNA polymerase-3 subunit gamma/tau
MAVDFHTKYRPEKLEEVVGQDHVVKSLEKLFKKELPHSFLFIGESGVGKTTLARIIAKKLGCTPKNIIEINAAIYNGVDTMRELADGLKYSAMGANPTKVVIIDEAHMLTKASWNALLKIIEEPPKHVYFIICTTEGSKVIKTIKTRCIEYNLKEVKYEDLYSLVEYVVTEEDIELEDEALELIVEAAEGSPRQALRCLEKCAGCESLKDVKAVLESVNDADDVYQLCKLLVSKNPTWKKASKILKGLKGTNIEGARIQIVNYLTSCLLGSKDESSILFFADTLDQFTKPLENKSTALGELSLSVVSVIYPD